MNIRFSKWANHIWMGSILLVFILLSGCQAAGPAVQAVQRVKISPSIGGESSTAVVRLATGEWEPYDGENLPHYGCDSWVVSEAFGLVGVKVEYGFFPWARGLRLAETGEWDGTLEWDDTPEMREKFFISADFLSDQEWVFFYRADRPFVWKSLNDLESKVIGLTSGYAYSDAFADLKKKGTVRFDEASTDEANFKKLLAGRIDVFPIERSVGERVMKKIFSADEKAQIAAHPTPFDEFRPYLLLSKAVPENEQRIELFNKGFALLKENGRYEEIIKDCLQ
jgi:polar amino acid transport system substrate-binding protein